MKFRRSGTLRKFLHKIKTIIGQYQSYPFSVKYLRKSCISASMPILNVTTFSTHFSLVLDRNAQLIMLL